MYTDPDSLTGARWTLSAVDALQVERLRTRLGLHPIAARCLALRGVGEPEDALRWLSPDRDSLHDPMAMLGMGRTLERLRRAVRDQESMRVVTDYDVDGTTSSLILRSALQLAGSDRISWHIPHRIDEGYGFSVDAAERAAQEGVKVIVTADIGVRDHAAVRRAAELGIDVLLCDHHLPMGEAVPAEAYAALCPPQKGCSYPNKSLAACGVSFKLAQGLLADHPKRDAVLRSMLKLAAIGTVADVVELTTPENRAIVALGLDALNRDSHSPGLAALLEISGLRPGKLDTTDLGFRIAPRINAAGRVSSAEAVIDLFTTRDPERARQRARELDGFNRERQQIQAVMLREAERQVPKDVPDFIVVAGEEARGWHRGVAGIVAARLRDQFNRPAAVVALTGGGATGSVRSLPRVHAVRALEHAADLLLRFGGHAAAAGFSLDPARLPALCERLGEAARRAYGPEAPVPEREVDAELGAEGLDMGLLRALDKLGPFGKGNPRPTLVVRRAKLTGARVLKDRHLKLDLLTPDGRALDAMWWDGAPWRQALAGQADPAARMDLCGRLEVDSWQGAERLRFVLEDARPG